MPQDKAAAFARRCNDYAAELIAQHPRRFGCFGLLPMHDIGLAIAEAQYCLDTLHFEGISLFASYGETFLGDTAFDPLLHYLDARNTVVHIHPSLHPSSKSLDLPWPGFMIEYPFDTTRAAVNLLFSGALERFPNIKFILSHAGGTLPYLAWRLSVAPMIDKRLKQRSARGHLRRASNLLVRQRTGLRRRADGRTVEDRRARAHRVRLRLAVLQRPRGERRSRRLHRARIPGARYTGDDRARQRAKTSSAARGAVPLVWGSMAMGMKRREFLAFLGGAATASPAQVRAPAADAGHWFFARCFG